MVREDLNELEQRIRDELSGDNNITIEPPLLSENAHDYLINKFKKIFVLRDGKINGRYLLHIRRRQNVCY